MESKSEKKISLWEFITKKLKQFGYNTKSIKQIFLNMVGEDRILLPISKTKFKQYAKKCYFTLKQITIEQMIGVDRMIRTCEFCLLGNDYSLIIIDEPSPKKVDTQEEFDKYLMEQLNSTENGEMCDMYSFNKYADWNKDLKFLFWWGIRTFPDF